MTDDPRLTALAASLPATVPFVGPETQERQRGRPFAARLGANENVFGPAPGAVAAMQAAAAEAWMYGDPENHELRAALAAHAGIAADHITIDAGIDTLLGVLVRLIIGAGDIAVTSDGAYPTFNYHVAGFGGALHRVPYTGDQEDPERLIATARREGAKLIYFSNPDNPMGTWHNADTVARMIAEVPPGCLLILDEAYVELGPAGISPAIDPDNPRVIRMRTFSKAYGMAGARVGYALGPKPLIAAFDRVRNHFGMCRISQAGALAALDDVDWLRDVQARVSAARDRIAGIARDNGLTAIPSATNFVSIDCGRDGGYARAVAAELTRRDIFVRKPFVPPQDRCIRISCGTEAQLDLVAAALPDALKAADRPDG